MQYSHVLDALFLLGDREIVCGAVQKAMPVERFCVLCMVRLRGREWSLESDCPTCLGVDSLKTYSEYIRVKRSRLDGGEPPRRSVRIAGRRAVDPIEDSHRSSRLGPTAVTSKIRKARLSKKGGGRSAAEAMADGKKSLILGGSGSSVAIAKLVGNAGLAQMSGEVEVVPRISGSDELFEEFSADHFGGSQVVPKFNDGGC